MIGIRRARTVALHSNAAAAELFAALWQPDICLVLVFVSPGYAVAPLAASFKQHFGVIPLAGCTTSGEIGPGGYAQDSIVGVSFAGPEFAASIGIIRGLAAMNIAALQDTVRRTRLAIYDAAPWARHENLFAITLIDGMSGCEERVASAACGALAGIPLRGGSAGDGLHFERTFVLFNGDFTTDCALIIVIASHYRFRAFKTEHFSPGPERCVVTAADPAHRVVIELNAEPAAAEYARITGLPLAALTQATFATHPMMVRIGGHAFVRSIQRVNPDLSLSFLCAVDEGVVLTVGQAGNLIGDLTQSFYDIEMEIGVPSLVLAFDCILRGVELDQRGLRETAGCLMDRMNAVGFLTYGEQYEAMHMNQTLAGIAIGSSYA